MILGRGVGGFGVCSGRKTHHRFALNRNRDLVGLCETHRSPHTLAELVVCYAAPANSAARGSDTVKCHSPERFHTVWVVFETTRVHPLPSAALHVRFQANEEPFVPSAEKLK